MTTETIPADSETVDPSLVAAIDAALTPEEVLRLENTRLKDELAAMKRDRAECVDLAEEHAAKLRDHEDLKSRAKKAKDEADVLADALSAKVRGEVQTEIDPEDDEQDIIQFTAPPAASNLDAIEVDGLDWSTMDRHVLSALVSTGKPCKIKPVEILGLNYVLVDVQDRIGVFHQVMDDDVFLTVHSIEGATRPDERSSELEALGQYAGIPVKIGRKVHFLGAVPLLVKMPSTAAVVPVSDEKGEGMVANRIFVHLESSGIDHVTVDALTGLLGVARDIVQLEASRSRRLTYDAAEDSVYLA